jgi:hypothetical protein
MQVMRLWAGGKTWAVTGEGFDPHGFFLDTEGAKGDVSAGRDPRQMLMISAYCNEAWLTEIDGRPAIQGNPTDGALVVAAAKADIHRAALKEKTTRRSAACEYVRGARSFEAESMPPRPLTRRKGQRCKKRRYRTRAQSASAPAVRAMPSLDALHLVVSTRRL